MKKLIIGALGGSLILFIWQFLSFAALGIHNSQMSYTPKQDTVLAALQEADLEEGSYFLPMAPPGTSAKEQEEIMKERIGKPWATLSYRKSLSNSMGMNMLRGWVVDFVAAFLLAWVLLKMTNLDLKTAVMSSVAIGLMGYFTINYLDSVWFKTDSIPDLIDAVVQWGLTGVWLGWWLPREPKA